MGNFDQNKEIFYMQLILEELEGTISAEDANILKGWKDSHPINTKIYTDVLERGNDLDLLRIYKTSDTEQSLKVLQAKLYGAGLRNQEKKTPWKLFANVRWMGIAAVLLLGIVSVIYVLELKDRVILETSSNNSKTFNLPDGSKIILNAGSKVQYSKRNYKSERTLELISGECFLDVLHDEKKPFSIQHGDVIVSDIGTSFNFSFSTHKITVSVNSGVVRMETRGAGVQELMAGEMAEYHLNLKNLKRSKIQDPNYKAYTDHHLVFNNARLEDVVKALESVYHQKIVITDKATKIRRFSGEFKNQSLKDINLVLAKALQLEVVTKEKVIYFNHT